MCLQITQFCTGSTRPLLLAGGLLSLLLAVAIGYTGCTSQALYNDIDPQVAQARSLSYYLQLAAAGYLCLVTIFTCYTAHYDQKHSIRVLAVVSVLNLTLAAAVILMMPPHQGLSKPFVETLQQAAGKYDRTNRDPPTPAPVTTGPPPVLDNIEKEGGAVLNVLAKPKTRRFAEEGDPQPIVRDLTKEQATNLWDKLQARGCCGINNGTSDWGPAIPKSCCAQPVNEGGQRICKDIDANHRQGCLALIDSTGLNLLIVLALIALVNLYLATISCISAYRTFHYNEASQSAYT